MTSFNASAPQNPARTRAHLLGLLVIGGLLFVLYSQLQPAKQGEPLAARPPGASTTGF